MRDACWQASLPLANLSFIIGTSAKNSKGWREDDFSSAMVFFYEKQKTNYDHGRYHSEHTLRSPTPVFSLFYVGVSLQGVDKAMMISLEMFSSLCS